MPTLLAPVAIQQFKDSNGNPLVGGQLYTYQAGTSIPAPSYTDATGTSANTNPVILNSRGEVPLWLTPGQFYKLVLMDAASVLIWSADQVPGGFVDAALLPDTASSNKLRTDLAATTGSALVGASNLIPVSVPYLQTISDINNGLEISIFRFIASSSHAGIRAETDTSDLLVGFQTAAANAKSIFIPYGRYFVSGKTMLSKDGSSWRGQGISASKIVNTSNNTATLGIASLINGVTLESFQLDRNIAPVTGGDGIDSSTVSIGQALFRRLLVQNNQQNMNLGPTDYSDVQSCILQKAYDRNLRMTNTATDGACQWSLDSVLMQRGEGGGLLFQTIAGPAQITLGTWKNIATFANSGAGVAVLGLAAVPVNDLRMVGGFIGEDGGSEIYLDTYGRNHTISGTFVELAGSRTTGRTLITPASKIGSGIEVTGNNFEVQMTGVKSDANSFDGFYLAGVSHPMGNCQATNNGQALVAGRRNGVNGIQGRVVINGGLYSNFTGGGSQLFGAFVADGNNLSVMGADLTNNITGTFGATVNAGFITAIGNLPNTGNVLLSPQGAVVVGGTASAGASIVGGINVAGGLAKNNIAYTNP